MSDRTTTALAGWFGSNRTLAPRVGEALEGCSWVGVLFAGGMSEVPHIGARTLVVNDKHKLIINLARVVALDHLRPQLVKRLARKAFHPDELANAQLMCKERAWELAAAVPSLDLAEHYFVCCWMGRGGKAGIDDEFNGRPSIRWKSDGGDSMVRYQSALRMLVPFAKSLRRCTFETMDVLDFLERCEDIDGHGLYADPPFPGAGRRYRHNAGQTDAEEREWHTRLRDALARFAKTRVVCRFYDHPLVRELYPAAGWEWRFLDGGKTQANTAAPEVLLVRNGPQPDLFAALGELPAGGA